VRRAETAHFPVTMCLFYNYSDSALPHTHENENPQNQLDQATQTFLLRMCSLTLASDSPSETSAASCNSSTSRINTSTADRRRYSQVSGITAPSVTFDRNSIVAGEYCQRESAAWAGDERRRRTLTCRTSKGSHQRVTDGDRFAGPERDGPDQFARCYNTGSGPTRPT
jgi:hypothetical protein